MARGFDSVPDRGGRDNLREDDLFDMFPLSKKAKNTWISMRFLPIDLLPIKKHWIKILGGKDKDKEVTIPRLCVSFDPDNEDKPLKGRECPYCKLEHGNDESGAPARVEFKYLAQAIIRDIQKTQPRKLPKLTSQEKKTGFKEAGSESWTPVRMVPLTPGVARRVREMGDRNFIDKKKDKTAPLNDAKYGLDVDIMFNPKAAGAEKYSIDKGDRTPLDSEEKEYLTYSVDNWEEIYDLLGRLDSKDALKDFQKMDVMGGSAILGDDDDDDDDDDLSLGKKSKKSKLGGKAKKSKFSDDDDDDDDEKPRKKSSLLSKKKPSKAKKSKFSDDDDDDDEAPKKKKSPLKSKKPSKAKKSKYDEDDDEDEAPKKKKSPLKSKTSGVKTKSKTTGVKAKKPLLKKKK